MLGTAKTHCSQSGAVPWPLCFLKIYPWHFYEKLLLVKLQNGKNFGR